MKQIYLLLLLLITCSLNVQSADVTIQEKDYNDWGWRSLVIENGYIELVIVPEIGGRIMRYAMPGDQQMAVNTRNIGELYDPMTDRNGPWSKGYGYGGYKNWPAPQTYWNWPPPPQLDWGIYKDTIEHQSADSVVVYLEGPVETTAVKGLQQARRITVYKNSTLVKVEQYLKNVNATVRDYAIWDITQTIVQHENSKDYSNFSVYFPNSNSIRYLRNRIKPKEITDGIYHYQTKSGEEKVFVTGSTWCANVDERDEQAYYKLFEYDANAKYSDQNSNFQLYNASDQTYIEIEVLGPLKRLEVGDMIRFDEYWSAANVKGIQLEANNAGSVLNSAIASGTYSGEYGIFNTGTVQMHYTDGNNSETGVGDKIEVEAGQKLSISETAPAGTEQAALYVYNSNDQLIDILSVALETSNGVYDLQEPSAIKVFPTSANPGEQISIYSVHGFENTKLTLLSLSGKEIKIDSNYKKSGQQLDVTIPAVSSGMYILKVHNRNKLTMQKLIII